MARRSVMTLFSTPTDPWSHRARLVLAEKGIAIELVNCDPLKLPEDLLDLNPYHSVPTLVDRDLVLYDSRVIMDYLDERFPHPPLMPIDPVTRAQFRVALYRVERDWYGLAQDIELDREGKSAAHSPQDPVRSDLRKRRGVQGQAVLPERRVFAGRREHRADSVAVAALRYRAAAPGAADREIHECDFRARHVPRVPERRRAGVCGIEAPPTLSVARVARVDHATAARHRISSSMRRRDGRERAAPVRQGRQDRAEHQLQRDAGLEARQRCRELRGALRRAFRTSWKCRCARFSGSTRARPGRA